MPDMSTVTIGVRIFYDIHHSRKLVAENSLIGFVHGINEDLSAKLFDPVMS